MKDIKFRVWDGNSMEYFSFREMMGNAEIRYDIGDKVMQFTGLTDKNDINIYDGDIVKFQMTRKVPSEGKVFAWVDETAVYQGAVKWGEFGWRPFIDGKIEESEIIGNIYENPELI